MEYKRLTGQEWSDDIDLTQELGYSYIYKRLYEIENKIEQGKLIDTEKYFIDDGAKYGSVFPYVICKYFAEKAIHDFCVTREEAEKRYERIEKIIKLAKMEKANGYEVKNGKLYYFSNMLGGCEIEFKDLQEICDMANHYNEEFWGLDQRLTFWKGKAENIRKETAEKFEPLRKYMWEKFHHYHDIRNKAEADYKKCKDESGKAVLNNDYHRADAIMFILGKVLIEFDEICKKIMEGKV